MHIGWFDYALPRRLIAQFPAPERTASQLLVLPARGRESTVMRFADIGRLLAPGDLLVVNDTRVLPARLAARKPSGGRVEILLERVLGGDDAATTAAGDCANSAAATAESAAALVQLRANKPIRAGQKLRAADADWVVTARRGELFVIECRDGAALAKFQSHGEVPLPPYIDRVNRGDRAERAAVDDAARYQTVYARADGAVAAPTAGLHFDRALLARLAAAGVERAAVTLHVGAATFQPVRAGDLAAHRMHLERVEVSRRACDAINRTRARGGRVVAVGTTVVRALESAAAAAESNAAADFDTVAGAGNTVAGPGNNATAGRESNPPLSPFAGETDLFIRPGHRFRVVDALVTNFHLPQSTLLVLVCAFAGYAKVMRAYRDAVARELRFYSYGDAMFVARDHRRRRQPRP
ncbi:MAG: tRNA preQ1(34) S-adenosylmethionine ribosyltransferase-isomerase QueA [Gammaproteobacteria bacterium]|nr:tRNA preQ1(34) S-adenosylmethionine ribosyltransferase-isomerase QueA [Gammaproteobacteria bacterium]